MKKQPFKPPIKEEVKNPTKKGNQKTTLKIKKAEEHKTQRI